MQRIPTNREAVLRVRVDDEGGTLTNATSTPTIDVRDGDGGVVAGVSAVTTDGTGVYKATLPPQAKLDLLSATWSVAVNGATRTITNPVMITGGYLVPLWRLREDAELTTLSTTAILRLAEAVEEWFAIALGFPPVLEPLRRIFYTQGGRRLTIPGAPFPKGVYALSEGETALTAADLADVRFVRNALEWRFVGGYDVLTGAQAKYWYPGRKTAWITHGGPWDGAAPEDLVRAAAVFARYLARGNNGGNYPERARQVATEGALITLATPSPEYPTGLPEVDAVLNHYRLDTSVV